VIAMDIVSINLILSCRTQTAAVDDVYLITYIVSIIPDLDIVKVLNPCYYSDYQ